MARAHASIVIDAPVEAVWAVVRDFGALASWVSAVSECRVEDGRDGDSVGCIRSLKLGDGVPVRERLLELDDCRYRFSYNFETPAFPVENYLATFELIPVVDGDRTFAQWSATFDEAPEDRGKYVAIVSEQVFATGLGSLAAMAVGRPVPDGVTRWLGHRPAKVFASSVIVAGIEAVWERMRDFISMDQWHPALRDMHMLAGARSDKVSGVREFALGDGELHEQLTLLSDVERAFSYRILKSPMPWLDYHAGAKLYPVTATGHTFAVWTADWIASPNDDVRLIPLVCDDVFQLAFTTLGAQLQAARATPV